MKTILVPTDFSKEADNALEIAYEIATRTGAKIELLHVIEALYEGDFVTSGTYVGENNIDKVFMLKLIEKSHKDLRLLVASKNFSDVQLKHNVLIGSVYTNVSEIITNKNIDLIIMGTKGKGGVKGLLVGSNTEKVVRLAKCLVLAVKDKTEQFNLKNLVLATSLDDYSSELILRVRDMQKHLKFQLHLLYVNTPSQFSSTDEAMISLKEIARLYKLENYSLNIINDYTVENGIMEFVYQNKSDLIAMSTHGRKGISHLIQGSISEDMVKYSGKPVLTHIIE